MANLIPMSEIKRLGICKSRIYDAMARGHLPYQRLGAHRLIKDDDLLKWLGGKPPEAERQAVAAEGAAQ